jgi:hypothetical protein
LIVAGDLGDRGPRLDKVIDLLTHQPHLAITWGITTCRGWGPVSVTQRSLPRCCGCRSATAVCPKSKKALASPCSPSKSWPAKCMGTIPPHASSPAAKGYARPYRWPACKRPLPSSSLSSKPR